MKIITTLGLSLLSVSLFTGCVSDGAYSSKKASTVDTSFTLAVIPDTQNYVDFSKQKNEGFALDASELFIQQMQYIADNSEANGGEIAFAASVGDVWQHQSKKIDEEHAARGITATPNPFLDRILSVTEKTRSVEIPKAIEGYQILADAGVPFGVAPGNHDHDAMWTASGFPPNVNKPIREIRMTAEDLGVLHIGGLDNFRSVFGDDKPFFKDKPWYVSSFNGGANGAQKFTAGGYTFLHFTLEMQASNEVVAWVEKVMADNLGLPTIFTTHDYLSVAGERKANPIVDLARVDPTQHNSAEQMWQKLYSQHDQIFLVLCGHQHGQSHRVDDNVNGVPVIQILADYQDRGQVGLDAGQPKSRLTRQAEAIGDGWFRLMDFDLNADKPSVAVKTYSPHYAKFSGDEANYVAWYKEHEHPELSDEAFLQTDDFVLDLGDFHTRFTNAKQQ